jgi:hypothetical protein
MCWQVVHMYLCRNEWCFNWAGKVLPNNTWSPCEDLDNYSVTCPNYQQWFIYDNQAHSNHHYCLVCRVLGYVDDLDP